MYDFALDSFQLFCDTLTGPNANMQDGIGDITKNRDTSCVNTLHE